MCKFCIKSAKFTSVRIWRISADMGSYPSSVRIRGGLKFSYPYPSVSGYIRGYPDISEHVCFFNVQCAFFMMRFFCAFLIFWKKLWNLVIFMQNFQIFRLPAYIIYIFAFKKHFMSQIWLKKHKVQKFRASLRSPIRF